jgi:hypothetical protein
MVSGFLSRQESTMPTIKARKQASCVRNNESLSDSMGIHVLPDSRPPVYVNARLRRRRRSA